MSAMAIKCEREELARIPYFKDVKFGRLGAIEFIGYIPAFEFAAFKIIDEDGKDTGYVGEFAPDDLRRNGVFRCVKRAYADVVADGDFAYASEGFCTDERIISALMELAYKRYPQMDEIANFSAIDASVNARRQLALPDMEYAIAK